MWPVGEVAVLALWLGAALFFGAAVAPALFAVLPSRSLAGVVVGRVLPWILYSGILIGALVACVEVATHGWRWRGPGAAAVVMIVACGVAQFVVAPRIERIRAQIAGPIEALQLNDPRRLAFGRLHGISVGWLGLAMLAAVAAGALAARSSRSA